MKDSDSRLHVVPATCREIHIEWTGRESWRENGLKPPMPGTEAEKLWIKEDKPIPFEPATGEAPCFDPAATYQLKGGRHVNAGWA